MLKKFLMTVMITLATLTCMGQTITPNATNPQTNELRRDGTMTYNAWSGKLSLDGTTLIMKEVKLHLTPDEIKDFRVGRALRTTGIITTIAGGIITVPSGYDLISGYYDLEGQDWYGYSKGFLIKLFAVGATTLTGGIVCSTIGKRKIQSVLYDYNYKGGQPVTLNVGPTANGVGLALNF